MHICKGNHKHVFPQIAALFSDGYSAQATDFGNQASAKQNQVSMVWNQATQIANESRHYEETTVQTDRVWRVYILRATRKRVNY